MADELTKMRAERRYTDAKAERACRIMALMECWRRLESCTDLAAFVSGFTDDPAAPDLICDVDVHGYAFGKLEGAETAFRHALQRMTDAQEWCAGAMNDAGRLC
jgi:hypothetical protein